MKTDPVLNLTAYALGELEGDLHAAARGEVERYLGAHPEAREFVEATRAAAALLTGALQNEASAGLGDERIAALLAEAETDALLPPHEEADEFSDEPHGTPVYHVITHPTAGPRHWRRTLLAVAAMVAIIASVLTATLSSMLHGPRNQTPIAKNESEPDPPIPFVFIPNAGDGKGGDPGAVAGLPDPESWASKPAQVLLPLPERSHDPLFGIGPVIVTRLRTPRPTTRESAPTGSAYAVMLENPFVEVTASPLSALPLKTGRASYANVKRAIEAGRLPAKDSVRVEELVNLFAYDYAAPSGGDVFAAHLETAACPWDESHQLVRIGLKAKSGAADEIVARAASMQIEFNPAKVGAYRLIGYDRRLSTRPNEAGAADPDITAGHAVTALYELVPATAMASPARTSLKYQSVAGLTAAAGSGELLTVSVRYRDPNGQGCDQQFATSDTSGDYRAASPDFQFAAATAAFGLVLRDSPHKGAATLDTVLALARPGLAHDELGVRAEFVELVKKAKAVKVS